MANVLVGVGGSGQHVIHAYLKMLALTACRPSDVPHVYIVDADATIGEVGLCQNISELHKRLTQPASQENRSNFALIRPYFMPYPGKAPGTASQNLELDKCSDIIKDIFLTDDVSDGAHATANDRTVELLQGMMANAKVGAMAFGFKLMRVGIDKELIEMNFGAPGGDGKPKFDLLSDVRKSRVAIVGSSFGGTGSGVIPALVRHLSAQGPGSPLAVRAFMTLPWFELDAGGNSAASMQAGGIDPKKRNSALGLRTYMSDLDDAKGRANYVVAQFLGEPATREDRGNFSQGEDPHVFNLLLATSIQSFLHETADTGAVPGGNLAGRKLYSLFTSKEQEVDGVFSAESSAHLRFRVKPDDNRQLLDIVREAEVLALALEKGAEFIRPGENQFKVAGSVKQSEPDTLVELCKNIAVSYEKKPLEKKGAMFMKKEVAPDEVYAKLSQSLRAVSETIRRSLLWIDGHRKTDDRPSGIAFSSFSHLFTIQKSPGKPEAILPASEEYLAKQWDAYGLKIKRKEGKGKSTELTPKTERVSQAFALFMNSLFNDKDYVAELNSLSQNQPGAPIYEVAAQMLAEAVFVEVIEARAASRSTDNLSDAQDNSKANGALRAFVKGVMVDPEADGSRLCVLSKAVLNASVGDAVGSGSTQDPIHEDHPVSLRQIDPYLGISKEQNYDVTAVARVAAGTSVFQESSLKGIPNVIAPLLLQKWRMELGSQNVGEGALMEQKNSVRLSKFGLFQHATKVVEAGFWLTFTNDPRVRLVNLNTDSEVENSHFCKLLNNELKLELGTDVENALPTQVLVLADSQGKNKGKVVLVADPRYGWYLPASSMARKFFGTVMAELPTVKYGTSRLDLAWIPPGGREQLEPGTFAANLTSAFRTYVRTRLLRVAGNSTAPWAIALREVDRCLTSLPIEECNLPPKQAGKIALLTGEGSELTQVQLFSPAALDQVKDLLIEKPVYFFVGPESTGADSWNGLWPIRGSAWEHVLPPDKSDGKKSIEVTRTVDGDPAIDQRSAWQVDNLRLNLKGLGVKDFRFPFGKGTDCHIPGTSEAMELLSWAAAIWPNFEAKEWHCYYAGGTWDFEEKKLPDFDGGNSFKAINWKLNFYGDFFTQNVEDGKAFGLIGTVLMHMPVKLKGVPRSVELVINERVMGSMPVLLNTLEALNGRPCDVAIDFGTSNTCVAYKEQGALEAQPLALLPGELLFGEKLPYLTALIGPKKAPNQPLPLAETLFKTPAAPRFIFQSFNKERKDGASGSIPSELINLKSRDYPGQSKYLVDNASDFDKRFGLGNDLAPRPQGMPQAVVTPHFTPFPPDPGGLDMADLMKYMGSGMHRGFKWPPKSGDGLGNIAYRSVYLEQILMAACASLRHAGIREVSRFVGTYPHAFNDTYRDNYSQHLTRLVQSCFESSGLRLTRERQVIMKSETISALASTNIGDEICVSIDMGGGTTDVGFVVPGMRREGEKNDFFSFMSSVEYAGTDLLKALIKSPALADLLGDVRTDDETKLNKLSIMIRAGGVSLCKPSVAIVAKAFFEALFEYVFGILSAIASDEKFPSDRKINVYLFGNGFKLIKVFLNRDPEEFLNNVIGSFKDAGLFTPAVAERIVLAPRNGDAKLSLIQGALKGAVGGDRGDSAPERLLAAVEAVGNGRVAIWYPCIGRPEGAVAQVTLGTAAERNAVLQEGSDRRGQLSLATRDLDLLKLSFPITHKYWDQSNAVNAIFNNAPQKTLISLGSYYLEGRDGIASSFAQVVLPALAAATAAEVSDGNY